MSFRTSKMREWRIWRKSLKRETVIKRRRRWWMASIPIIFRLYLMPRRRLRSSIFGPLVRSSPDRCGMRCWKAFRSRGRVSCFTWRRWNARPCGLWIGGWRTGFKLHRISNDFLIYFGFPINVIINFLSFSIKKTPKVFNHLSSHL